ncbi:hypothetical protein BURMUCF2_3538 [Burkholderia multivorans CF2]|nr:hypothetical protein BURMUCF2_3538 [Burkholderia multivorans CF2]
MQADEQRSHERIHRAHRGWRAGRIGRWPGRDGLRIMEATHTQRRCGGGLRARKPACAASQCCACYGWSDNARHSNAMQMILNFVSFA